jgi:uncharacterized protein (TIGR03067 family)
MRQHAWALGVGLLLVGFGALLAAGDARDEAISKERKKFEGTWRVVALQVDGNKAAEADAKKITVTNAVDGKWTIEAEGKVVARGTSVIDPTKKPKTVALMPGGKDEGKVLLGIYEFSGNDTRKVCLGAAGKGRPTELAAPPGSGRILAVLQRVKK